ncbi:hypothetical protein OH76DRAFT_100530 [Lentinus brumalis]|uniref:Secreted protein n=1 Tax=Lentinus brumalis TaxID=2498619 RepID=A0A371CQF4_9APHY|nr:hypothetical protein OH76DRAFT_100530 [Polyporus brumalis]
MHISYSCGRRMISHASMLVLCVLSSAGSNAIRATYQILYPGIRQSGGTKVRLIAFVSVSCQGDPMLLCLAPSLTVCGTWSLWRRCAILHLPRCEVEKRLAGTLILKAQKKSASMSRHRSKKLERRTRRLTQLHHLGQILRRQRRQQLSVCLMPFSLVPCFRQPDPQLDTPLMYGAIHSPIRICHVGRAICFGLQTPRCCHPGCSQNLLPVCVRRHASGSRRARSPWPRC